MEPWICKYFGLTCFVFCPHHNWMYCLHPEGKGVERWPTKLIGGDSADKI